MTWFKQAALKGRKSFKIMSFGDFFSATKKHDKTKKSKVICYHTHTPLETRSFKAYSKKVLTEDLDFVGLVTKNNEIP